MASLERFTHLPLHPKMVRFKRSAPAAPPILEDLSIHSLTLVGDLPEDLTCSICLGALEKPVQCSNGHLFCRACAEQVVKKAKKCPVCRCSMTAKSLIRPPSMVSNALGNIVVHCPHFEAAVSPKKPAPRRAKKKSKKDLEEEAREAGCLWTGPHQDLEGHLKSDCAHALRDCNLCEERMAQSLIEHHVQEECPERSMPCAFCNNGFKIAELKDHEDMCNKSPHVVIACICGVKLARGEIDEHVKKDISGHFQSLMTQNQTLAAAVDKLGIQNGKLDAAMSMVLAQNQVQEARNRELEARLKQMEHKVAQDPVLFTEFKLLVPVAFNGDRWSGPDFSFGGINFSIVFHKKKKGLYLFSRASINGGYEISVSLLVNGQSIFTPPQPYRSDGTSLSSMGWVKTGLGNDFELPLPVNGFHHLNVRIVREK